MKEDGYCGCTVVVVLLWLAPPVQGRTSGIERTVLYLTGDYYNVEPTVVNGKLLYKVVPFVYAVMLVTIIIIIILELLQFN